MELSLDETIKQSNISIIDITTIPCGKYHVHWITKNNKDDVYLAIGSKYNVNFFISFPMRSDFKFTKEILFENYTLNIKMYTYQPENISRKIMFIRKNDKRKTIIYFNTL